MKGLQQLLVLIDGEGRPVSASEIVRMLAARSPLHELRLMAMGQGGLSARTLGQRLRGHHGFEHAGRRLVVMTGHNHTLLYCVLPSDGDALGLPDQREPGQRVKVRSLQDVPLEAAWFVDASSIDA